MGGALGVKAEAAGKFVAQGSAKVAAASGDQQMVNFYTSNASAIGVGVGKSTDLAVNTAESHHSNSSSANQSEEQRKKVNPQ